MAEDVWITFGLRQKVVGHYNEQAVYSGFESHSRCRQEVGSRFVLQVSHLPKVFVISQVVYLAPCAVHVVLLTT